MKRIFAIFTLTFCLSISHAQDAVYLVSNPQSARWSYLETDSKGNHISTVYYSVASMDGDAVNGKIKLLVEEVPVSSPDETSRSYDFYRFKDGEFMVDLIAGFEDSMFDNQLDSIIRTTINEKYPDISEAKMKEVIEKTKLEFFTISGEPRGIPRYPKVGKLPDFEFYIKVNIISMKVLGRERKIVGTESLQTPAGLFDCFILEETITTKAMMMNDVAKTRSWYAYGIGLVKEITYDKNGKLISTMTLNEVN